jgi:phosphate starvation-inducible protein PhoH|tara:strand:- start:715 stop:1458 length:744 start_codon:yes stop_codon:yes gene_type:complete
MSRRRLTKTKKIQHERESEQQLINTKFGMKVIVPITDNQDRLFQSYQEGKNLLAIGSAGTGKTYISLYLALKDVMAKNDYKEIIIVRSTVQSREQGHMPGDAKDKAAHFEVPYADIVNDLFGRPDAYTVMKQKNTIRFMSTSFIRGLTFDDALIIVDECQNMRWDEIRTIMTRVGEGSRIIFCGDTKQDDLQASKNRLDVSGLRYFKRVIDKMGPEVFETIEFTVDDIVRSGLVKEFIMAEELLEAA